MYCPQNVKNGNYILLGIPENKGGPGNPSIPIDVNAFRTTNFQSRFALRGAEFHGNNHRDSTTRIPSIGRLYRHGVLFLQYFPYRKWQEHKFGAIGKLGC